MSFEEIFIWEAIFKKGGMFKNRKVIQYIDGTKLKNDMIEQLGKHNVDIQRTTMKYSLTRPDFLETFNKDIAKQLF